MKIHERIREARIEQGRRLIDIARTAQVDNAHLIRFERGEKGMTSDNVDRVLAALGLEVRAADDHDASETLEDSPTVT